MKNYCIYSATIIIIIFVAFISLNNSGGPNVARSGSPLESGATCVTCHSSFALNSGTGSVSIFGITSYIPGNTYSITVAVEQSSPKPMSYGFQGIVLAASDNSIAGVITVIDAGTKLKAIAGRNYIEHNTPGDSSVWTFEWIAPSTNVGDVKFYFSGNATNGNGGTAGDYIYNSVTTIPPDSTTATEIISKNQLDEIKIYPNPNHGTFKILLTEPKQYELNIVDIRGAIVYSEKPVTDNEQISINVSKGMYFTEFISEKGTIRKTMLVK